MLDEKVVIGKLEKRINEYLISYPDKENSVEVCNLREMIHELQLAADDFERKINN